MASHSSPAAHQLLPTIISDMLQAFASHVQQHHVWKMKKGSKSHSVEEENRFVGTKGNFARKRRSLEEKGEQARFKQQLLDTLTFIDQSLVQAFHIGSVLDNVLKHIVLL